MKYLRFLKSSFKDVYAFQIKLEFGNVDFWAAEGKTRVPEENLSKQRRELKTNSTHT